MSQNERADKATKAMEDIGIVRKTARHVLKSLWQLYEGNWDFIEAENYRALADAIFDYQEEEVKKENKRKDTELSNEDEPQIKRSRSTQPPYESTPQLNRKNSMQSGNMASFRGGCSNSFLASTPNNHKPPQNNTRTEVEPNPVLFRKPSQNPVLFRIPSQDRQTHPRQDTTGVSRSSPWSSRTRYGSAPGQESQRSTEDHLPHRGVSGSSQWSNTAGCGSVLGQELQRPTEEHLSHRAKGKRHTSQQNGSGKVSVGLSFKEPKIEHGEVIVHSSSSNNAFNDHSTEPSIGNDENLELALVVHPLSQYPSAMEDEKNEANGISPASHSTGRISENSYSNFEIAASPLGEVNISLSCSSSAGRADFHMPSLDEVLKLAGGRCHKLHQIINPNVSLVELMEKLCQYFLQLTSNPASNDINITPVGRYLKNSCATASDGTDCGHNHMSSSSSNGQQNTVVHGQPHNVEGKRQPHNLNDISKGEERVRIPVVSKINSEQYPPCFRYISRNAHYQGAHVNFSLARIGDEDSCTECFGDCLTAPIPCACTKETGGVFAYTVEGNVKKEFLDKCISMKRNPKTHYCEDCPLERSKSGWGKCKGHISKNFIKECWIKCGCDKQCGNRVVQRGISHRLEVFLTPAGKGWGVRTVEDLPRGAFVCEYVGEILTNIELYNRNQESNGTEKHTYPVLLDADWYAEDRLEDEEALCLDGTRFGNIARFINHRCFDGNLIEIPVEIETPDHHYYHVAFFTSRAVPAFEELTWDYGIDFCDVDHPIKAFRCQCRSQFCRDTSHLTESPEGDRITSRK
ncbi:[histone H3]-lysine(4) N-trimethyltransferase [Ranunculus cassubicifolius]